MRSQQSSTISGPTLRVAVLLAAPVYVGGNRSEVRALPVMAAQLGCVPFGLFVRGFIYSLVTSLLVSKHEEQSGRRLERSSLTSIFRTRDVLERYGLS